MVFPGRDILVVLYGLPKVMLCELTGFHHQRNNSIDSGARNLPFPVLQGIRQGIHGEVSAQFKNLFCHKKSLIGNLQISLLQEVRKIGKFTVNICSCRHGEKLIIHTCGCNQNSCRIRGCDTKWIMEEKRKFPRADLVFRIEYRTLKEEQPHTGMTRDIGLGGVSLETEAAMEKGTPLSLTFSFPELEGTIHATGRVVRSWEEDGKIFAALKFTAVHQDDLAILQSHLEQFYDQ